MADLHGQMSVLDPYFSIQFAGFGYVIKRIWHSLTVVIKFIKLVLKNVIKLVNARLITFFNTRLMKFYLNS